MPHVELSLSEPSASRPRPPARSALGRWADAVTRAGEASLVVDARSVIVALSPPCHLLLGFDGPAVGRHVLDVLKLLDFSGNGVPLAADEAGKIPPVLALTSGRLARGLIRVDAQGAPCTLDAIATPLLDRGATAGSLTFFSPV